MWSGQKGRVQCVAGASLTMLGNAGRPYLTPVCVMGLGGRQYCEGVKDKCLLIAG